jgi:Type II secretion system (T2SS), protein G
MDSKARQSVGALPFVMALLGFIPLIGIPFAITAIVVGINRKSALAPIIGLLGIASTVAIYGTLFYQGFKPNGAMQDSWNKVAAQQLNGLVPEVEYFKLQRGRYPGSLADLKQLGAHSVFFDTGDFTKIWSQSWSSPQTARQSYFYQLTADGQHYYLRSVGVDGQAFTTDDILPTLPTDERLKTGLVIDRP